MAPEKPARQKKSLPDGGGALSPAGGILHQAKVISAFMRAFGAKLRTRASERKELVAKLHDTPPGTSRLWARNARLMIEDDIALLLENLQAELRVLDIEAPLIPEQADGYTFHIQRGRMAMDAASITALMNRHAFPKDKPAPLTNIRVTIADGEVGMDAVFRPNALVAIPLSMSFRAEATADGRIALVATKIRALGLPVDRMMGGLGLQLERMMPSMGSPSMGVEGDRVLINPVGMLPAPKATGVLVAASVSGDHLVMTYDNGEPAQDPPLSEPDAESYIAMLGHDLLVGKITMTDVSLQVVPLDAEAGWVEFALPHYRAQLAQGISSLRYGDELLYRIPNIASLGTSQLVMPPEGRRKR